MTSIPPSPPGARNALTWRPRAVFLDAVGTLIHPRSGVAEVYVQAGRRHGLALPTVEVERRFARAFQRQEELDLERGLRTGEARERARWRAIVSEVFAELPDPAAPLDELWNHFAQPAAWECYPDVDAVLPELSALGIPLGIASNFDGRLRAIVAGLEPLRSCCPLAISAEIGWRKPALQFFAAAIALVGLPSSDVLLVGDDWQNDIEGGQRAGLEVLYVNRHRGPAAGSATLTAVLDLIRRVPVRPEVLP